MNVNTRKTPLNASLCAAAAAIFSLLGGCHSDHTAGQRPADSAAQQAATQHLEAGAKLGDSGQPDAAIVELQEGLRLDPNHAGGHLVLGRAYSQKKDNARYEAECQEAIRLKPEWEDPYVELGRARILLHRYQEALAPLNTALQIAPNSAFAHYYLGNALVKLNKRAEARQQWQIVVQSGDARIVDGAQKQLARYP